MQHIVAMLAVVFHWEVSPAHRISSLVWYDVPQRVDAAQSRITLDTVQLTDVRSPWYSGVMFVRYWECRPCCTCLAVI